jgi:DinB superfamily
VDHWNGFVAALLLRVQTELGSSLSGAAGAELDRRWHPDVNPVGWLAWHLTRSHDRNFSEIAGGGHLWIEDQWCDRFQRHGEPNDTGFLHTRQQVDEFQSPSGDVIMGYHDAVVEMAIGYLEGAPPGDLTRIAPSQTLGTTHTVQERLVGVLNEAFQHLGQIKLQR